MATATATAPAMPAELAEREDSELLRLLHAPPGKRGSKSGSSAGDAEGERACEILVQRYQSLVRACVQRYRDSPEQVEDLMQVGYVGLLKAINNFDPEVGSSLAAYAQPCISGEIKRHFRDKRWTVHVKRSAQELLLRVRAAREEMTHQLGRAPRDQELASHLGVGIDDLLDARRADMVFHSRSLDAPVSNQEDPSLADLLGEDDPQVEHTLDMEAVHTHWNDLPERERHILTLRFYGNKTQAQIGEELGISQMHVSRLLARALGYLRGCLLGSEQEDARPVSAAG